MGGCQCWDCKSVPSPFCGPPPPPIYPPSYVVLCVLHMCLHHFMICLVAIFLVWWVKKKKKKKVTDLFFFAFLLCQTPFHVQELMSPSFPAGTLMSLGNHVIIMSLTSCRTHHKHLTALGFLAYSVCPFPSALKFQTPAALPFHFPNQEFWTDFYRKAWPVFLSPDVPNSLRNVPPR